MAEKLLSILRSRRAELGRIDAYFDNWGQITAWHAGTRPIISKYFKDELEHFDGLRKVTFRNYVRFPSGGRGERSTSAIDERELDEKNKKVSDVKQSLLAHLDAMIALTEADEVVARVAEEQVPALATRRVFLVHGHDEAAKHSVARFLEKLKLEPVILHEQPNQGRTIIEKFTDYSDVAFAVVLLTGDDIGGVKGSKPSQLQPRARQNVILELGFFLGKLGRDRVFALYEPGVEIPSDFDGVVWEKLDGGNGWKLKLAQELRAAALPIDMNDVL